MLQSIHFDRNIWTLHNARNWIINHHIKPIKSAHVTDRWIMYRISEPIQTDRYYSKYITDGVLYIFD
jgi:hypothetical protein